MDIEAFKKALVDFSDHKSKVLLIGNWLSQIQDPEGKLQNFVTLMKGNFDYSQIHDVFIYAKFTASKIPSICKALYPNYEFAQVDIFKEFIKAESPTAEELRGLINEFAPTLHNDDDCLDILEWAQTGGLQRLDVLLIAKDRLSSHYASVGNLLDIPLRDALVESAWDNLKNYFGNDLPENLKLIALFSYFDISKNEDLMQQLGTFNDLVEKEILKQIKENYTPPSTSSFIMRNEHDKLRALGIEPLPDILPLSRYLKNKVMSQEDNQDVLNLPTIEDSIKAIDAEIAAYDNDKNKTENEDIPEIAYKKKFKALLAAGSAVTSKEVHDFFKSVTGLDLVGEEHKLFELFNKRKQSLAYLFSKKNGIQDYISIIRDIGHGCAANIGTKTNMYILGELFKDPIDQVLFPFYSENIVTPIINTLYSQGTDALGSSVEGINIFSDNNILTAHLSPQGLIAGLSAELSNDPKKAAKLIKTLATTVEFDCFDSNILDYDDKNSAIKNKPNWLVI